jgi:hypothetical protein
MRSHCSHSLMSDCPQYCNCCEGGLLERCESPWSADYEDREWFLCKKCGEYNPRFTQDDHWLRLYAEHDAERHAKTLTLIKGNE